MYGVELRYKGRDVTGKLASNNKITLIKMADRQRKGQH